jgi:hypothetical protein
MNLSEIKTRLEVETLGLSYLRDEKGERAIDTATNKPTQWLRHWDDDKRRAIVLHEDTLKLIKATPAMDNLGTKKSTKQPEGVDKEGNPKKPYELVVIIAHKPVDEVL